MAKKKATKKKAAAKGSRRTAPGSNLVRFDCCFTKQVTQLVEELARNTPHPTNPKLKQSRMGMLEDLLWASPKLAKLAKAKGISKPLRPTQGQRPDAVKKAAAAKKKAAKKKATKKKAK